MELLIVGIGGFIGSCARYGIARALARIPEFPAGTLLANVIAGCLIGIIIGLERQSVSISHKTKLLLVTGFLGGLSTFSTFSLETVTLAESGRYGMALANIGLNLGLSLLGVVAGLAVMAFLFAKQ